MVDLRYDASTSAVKLDDPSNEKSEGSKVRRRVQNMFKKDKEITSESEKSSNGNDSTFSGRDAEEVNNVDSLETSTVAKSGTTKSNTDEDAPPTYSDSVNEYLLDPMQQFSAFPPVTLRKAQLEFRQSLRLATTLLSEQQHFSGMSVVATGRGLTAEREDKA